MSGKPASCTPPFFMVLNSNRLGYNKYKGVMVNYPVFPDSSLHITGPHGGTTLGWETHTPTYMYEEHGDATGFVLRIRDKTLASTITHFLEYNGVPDGDGVVTVTVSNRP